MQSLTPAVTSDECAAQTGGKNFAFSVSSILFGSLFLAIAAKIAIPLPFTPVPLSLQTLAVGLISLALGKRAPFAVGAYLFEATLGFPVLAGGKSDPLWMLGPKAGYLTGFFLASFMMGHAFEKNATNSFLKKWAVLLFGECIILGCGVSCLSLFFGFPTSFKIGVLPFLPGAFAKSFAAATASSPLRWIQGRFFK